MTIEPEPKKKANKYSATELGVAPFWRVRVVMRSGGMIHLASADEPRLARGVVSAAWLRNHPGGDTIGWIEWDQVAAITWRWCE